jgi:hypothetical protein
MIKFVFPCILATGGLEQVACTSMALDQQHYALTMPDLCCLVAGCLDAPQSIPAGSSTYRSGRPTAEFISREGNAS